jgi:hypothetical protein
MKEETTTIFHGGHIVTMNEAQPQAEALVVESGKITAVGSLDEVKGANLGSAVGQVSQGKGGQSRSSAGRCAQPDRPPAGLPVCSTLSVCRS